MRTMNLLEVSLAVAQTHEKCIELYSERLIANEAPWPDLSAFLSAYLAWPSHEDRRNSFVATYLARFRPVSDEVADDSVADSNARGPLESFGGISAIAKVAFDQLTNEIAQIQCKWLLTADIFQFILDMAYDKRIALRRGASVSKAVDLCELERGLPGHSQLRGAWSEFRDVAHLLTAGAHLAHVGLGKDGSKDEASILHSIWIAPDIVLALAYGLQEFGLQPKPIRNESSILRADTLWRVPDRYKPEQPFVICRPLTEDQLAFLDSRRVA
jgi:hypothetical protein